MERFLTRWLGTKSPLKHYVQHLLIGLSVYLLVSQLLVPSTSTAFIFFILGTYLIDLDGLLFFLFNFRKLLFSTKARAALKSFHFFKAATVFATEHKSMNKLYLHNVFGFIAVCVLIFSAYFVNINAFYFFAAVLIHFIFDIMDDFIQLGHMRNWLWVIPSFSSSKSQVKI